MREIGPIKGREFMRRVTRVKDEDDIWYSYWMKGNDYNELLLKRRPDTATKMHERYAEYVEKITAYRKKELEKLQREREKDKELDEKVVGSMTMAMKITSGVSLMKMVITSQ